MTQRGRVLRDTNTGPGLVTVDGKQFAFMLEEMWRSDVPPRMAWQSTTFRKVKVDVLAMAALSIVLGHGQIMRAQATENPEYAAAKATAMANWVNPPFTADAGKDAVAVLTRDANQLSAARTLYKTASPAVQGAVDGSLIAASGSLKSYADTLTAEHHCELTPLPATASPLTRAASQVTDVSLCLGGQPAETLGHKIANQGYVRAAERQATFGLFGRGDKTAALIKGTDPKYAGGIDFAVQQAINNFSKNDLAAEIARERKDPSPQPAPPVPAAAPATPLLPSHPASTVVDLPPAAPGYPPMHASSPAPDGCWWAPFASEKLGLEAAVLHCEGNGSAVAAGESGTGMTLSSGSSSPPEQVLTLETKPAGQTMEAAIKQQFIMKLKSSAARLSCRATCETESDGMISCKVIATGAYSKLKKFNQDDDSSEAPCPGLKTNAAITVSFLARPSESKAKFLLFSADDMGGALNDATIHFLAQP